MQRVNAFSIFNQCFFQEDRLCDQSYIHITNGKGFLLMMTCLSQNSTFYISKSFHGSHRKTYPGQTTLSTTLFSRD